MKDLWIWALVAAGAAAVYYFQQSQGSTATATPLSVYPEAAWTKTTSMAATPQQQASTKTVLPITSSQSASEANVSAIYAQCVGAAVCSPLAGDTQLGF